MAQVESSRQEPTPVENHLRHLRSNKLGGVHNGQSIFKFAIKLGEKANERIRQYTLGNGEGLDEREIIELSRYRAARDMKDEKLRIATASCIGLAEAIEQLTALDARDANHPRQGVNLVMHEWTTRDKTTYRVFEVPASQKNASVKRVGFVYTGDGEIDQWRQLKGEETDTVTTRARSDRNQSVTSLGWENGKVIDSRRADLHKVLALRDLTASDLLNLPTVTVGDENLRALSYVDAWRKLGASDFFAVMLASLQAIVPGNLDWDLGRSSALGRAVLDAIGQRINRPTKPLSFEQFTNFVKEHVIENERLHALFDTYGISLSFINDESNQTAAFMITRQTRNAGERRRHQVVMGALFTNTQDIFGPNSFHLFRRTPKSVKGYLFATHVITQDDDLRGLTEKYVKAVSRHWKQSSDQDSLGRFLAKLEF